METNNTNLDVKVEFAVEMKDPSSVEKVKETLKEIKGVQSVDVCLKSQRVVVEGQVVAETVRNTIEEKTGLLTIVMGQGSGQHNLGAGISAIQFGSHGVLGLMRFIQKSPEMCYFEGTLDNLPETDSPLFMTVQESGDLSAGLYSTGSLMSNQKGFDGFISRLLPDQEHRAEFQTTSSNVHLSELIGHCVCVHKGSRDDVKENKSERLACGIVARASGLFQNSKRFCTCDGVTLWEQRKADVDRMKQGMTA